MTEILGDYRGLGRLERPLRLRLFPLFIKEGVRGSSRCPSAEGPGELGVPPRFKNPPSLGDYRGLDDDSIHYSHFNYIVFQRAHNYNTSIYYFKIILSVGEN
jgi:hypothetical protein